MYNDIHPVTIYRVPFLTIFILLGFRSPKDVFLEAILKIGISFILIFILSLPVKCF